MTKKEQIEELYINSLSDDTAPNVFAEQILFLFGVVKSLKVEDEIVFGDWLKLHKFTKSNNNYIKIKNGCTYREWEIFNMYTMDVYNL